jgi:DNA-binding HxlR family transcriptional regulator
MAALAGTHHRANEDEGLERALRVVGDRWTLLIVAALLPGPRRFNDLLSEVSGVASNVLTQRLRQLEGERLVVAQRYSERPLRHEYELTEAGRTLSGVVREIEAWGSARAGAGGQPAHAECGTPLDVRWWCPTCERVVDDDEGGGTAV